MPKRGGSSLYFNSTSRFPWFFSVPSSRTSNGSFPPSCLRSLGQAYPSEQVLKPGFAAHAGSSPCCGSLINKCTCSGITKYPISRNSIPREPSPVLEQSGLVPARSSATATAGSN
jgi:hypothetical protein